MAWAPKGNIKGPKGDAGATGATGAQGAQGPAGSQGAQGPQGVKGDTGNTGPQGATGQAEAWWSGAGVPPTATGAIGDWYLNTSTSDVYEKTASSTWTLRCNIKGAQGIQGTQGPQGNAGAQGPQGATGATGATGQAEAWWSGSGAPSAGLGAVGDFYLNHADGAVSEKTGSSTWTTRTNIMGPQGPQGAAATASILLFASAGNPAQLVGATGLGKMCGLGATFKFTPIRTGTVIISLSANIAAAVNGAVVWASIRGQTGTPPANGASGAGASGGDGIGTVNQSYQNLGSAGVPASFQSFLSGLALGVPYWVDLVLTNSGTAGNVYATYPLCQVMEL